MCPMFVPGPVDVHPDVLAAQTRPMLPHRSKEFEAIFQRASERAKQVFFTGSPVFLVTASGTAQQEAAVRNLAKETVLSCVNGAFASRWYDVAVANGKAADKLEFAWEQPVDPGQVAAALRRKSYELVTVVHNETSTGLQNPIAEIAAAVKEASPGTLLCVDAVSSLGGVKIEMDDWGLDMLFTSSQKCLGLPPGIALGALSPRALAYAQDVPNRGWYLDFVRMETHRQKDSTPATPAMSLIFALDLQLERILAEGLEARFARHSAMARRVQDWAEGSGLKMYAPPGYRSQTVTTLHNNLELDLTALSQFLQGRGMRIAGGYGPLKGKTLRIAHMAETTLEDIERLLQALDEFITNR